MKKKNVKRLFIGAGIVMAIFFVGVVGLFALLFSAPDTEEAAALDKEKQTAVVTPKEYKVGDTISYEGLDVTIKGAEFTHPAQYGEPEKGKVLTVTVEAVNNTDKEAWFENINFKVYDETGTATDYYYSYDESPVSAKLSPGKRVEGKVYFDVPEGSKYELIYTPSPMTFDNADGITINIQL